MAKKEQRTYIEQNKSFSTKNIIEFIGFIISKIDMDGKAVNVCYNLELVQVIHIIVTRGFALWPIFGALFQYKKKFIQTDCDTQNIIFAHYFPFDCLMLMSMRHRICVLLFLFYLFFSKVPLIHAGTDFHQ